MYSLIEQINFAVWGVPLIALLLGTGLYYTIKLRFIQFKLPKKIFYINNLKKTHAHRAKTVCMSLGASMGTGNIAGTASALAIGGPGAILWMWVSAFLGMALVYAENKLSEKYSNKNVKGTMAYLSLGIGSKIFALFFSFFCVLASLGMGGMTQVNTFSSNLYECIGPKRYITGAIIFIIIISIIVGGAKRIGSTAQLIIPISGVVYGSVCLAVIFLNIEHIPKIINEIISQGVGFKQFTGGISGNAISIGIRRGLFSNEAGLGSSPLLHSSANTNESLAWWSMAEVMIDMLCCTLTGLTVLCGCDTYLITDSLKLVLGETVNVFLTSINGMFALCTVIGWYYCGETAFLYISRGKARFLFCFIFAIISASGAIFEKSTVWIVSDIFNGLMAFPNIIGLILLNKEVTEE